MKVIAESMVTSVSHCETFSLIKNNIRRQSKTYKNHFENSNFWGMWPLGRVGHVTYSFINMLFISTGIFCDKLRPQILSVGTTIGRNTSNHACQIFYSKSNCETMYHWFFMRKITVVKIMNDLPPPTAIYSPGSGLNVRNFPWRDLLRQLT
jgi:hypothetical protein